MDYVLSYDVGTSALKGILVSKDGKVLSSAIANYSVSYPRDGFVEEDPLDWWKGVVYTTRQILKGCNVDPRDIKGMVFGTQAMNVIPVSEDGEILDNAIIWMDSRAGEEASEIVEMFGGVESCEAIFGTIFTGKDSLPKVRWIMKNKPEVFEKMDCFLDLNGYLIFMATGEKVYDMASASFLGYNRETGGMIPELLATSGYDPSRFPRIVKSYETVGHLTEKAAQELGLTTDTAVFGGTNDMQCSTIGSGMAGENEAHVYLGTSGWVAVGTNKVAALSNGGGCIMSADPEMQLWVYSTETCCATFNWFIEKLYGNELKAMGETKFYDYIEDVVSEIPAGSENLIFNPWISGERSPIQDIYVRGGLLNIGMQHTRAHMLRAVMEGIAYNLRWCYDSMENDLGIKKDFVRILGGGTKNRAWMQIFADIFNRKIEVIKDTQNAGAIGAAFLGALGLGVYDSFDDAKEWAQVECVYEPNAQNAKDYEKYFENFKESYRYLKDFYQKINKEEVTRVTN